MSILNIIFNTCTHNTHTHTHILKRSTTNGVDYSERGYIYSHNVTNQSLISSWQNTHFYLVSNIPHLELLSIEGTYELFLLILSYSL